MRAIEGSKLRRLGDADLQARIESLRGRVNMEENCSRSSRLHVKLLQDYDEAMNAKNMRDIQASMSTCMETIAKLEREIELYKIEVARQYEVNQKLYWALQSIKDNTEKEISRALS